MPPAPLQRKAEAVMPEGHPSHHKLAPDPPPQQQQTPGSSLFRRDFQQAQALSWLGQPVLPSHLPLRLMGWGALLFTALLAAFLIFGEYTRRVRVQGVVLPSRGLTRIVAPSVGWVRAQHVAEGDAVRQGQLLYDLSLDSTTATGATQEAVLDLLRRRRDALAEEGARQGDIDRLEKQGLEAQAADMDREAAQVEQQIRIATENTAILAGMLERQRSNMQSGLATSRDYEARLQNYIGQQTQLESLKRERLVLAARISEVRNKLAAFDLQAASRAGELERQIIDIDRQLSEAEAKREVTITAPRSGIVTGIITQAGQTVAAGTPLLTILPDEEPLEAQLLAPSNAIGFVREGDRVLLRYQAYPYQRFGQFPGTISVISRATLRPEEVEQLISAGADRQQAPSLYRITVRPDQPFVTAYGRREPLQAGMQLEAHILAESRPLYQWMLDPLYSLRGALSAGGGGGTAKEPRA
ncbi:HlyD family secretion protein [Roseomonas sp. ACRSG]|nr:HlyD family secretion protein [Roseomonas sp. ACRSG]